MKVYVVEVGAYSDRYVDAVFATEELAQQYVIVKARNAWERQTHRTKLHPFPDPAEFATWGEWRRAAETRTGHWNEFGDVEEYDLWDTVPALEAEEE